MLLLVSELFIETYKQLRHIELILKIQSFSLLLKPFTKVPIAAVHINFIIPYQQIRQHKEHKFKNYT